MHGQNAHATLEAPTSAPAVALDPREAMERELLELLAAAVEGNERMAGQVDALERRVTRLERAMEVK